MKGTNLVEGVNAVKQIEKKVSLLIGGRLKNKTGIKQACHRIDILRKKLSTKLRGWDSTAEIRKWRDLRCIS